MICAYCEQPIEDAQYIYKWFPDKQKTLPVHTYHLNTGGKQNGE